MMRFQRRVKGVKATAEKREKENKNFPRKIPVFLEWWSERKAEQINIT